MRKFFSFPLLLLLCGCSAYFLQAHMFLNGDVGSLLYDTRLFLQGGTYIHNFLETNPPMIFIIYSPVIFLSKCLPLNIVMIVRLYIILLALFSVYLCNILLKKIIHSADHFLHFMILLGLLFSFLFLPGCEFGQREHFFMMLIMPYVFLAVLAAQQQKINKKLIILIAIMAALGIGMKPYFLAPFILVEFYLILVKRSVFSALRLESCIIVSLLTIYLIWVFTCYPTYIYQMMPLVFDLYFIGIKNTWALFFSNLSVSYVVFVMLLCVLIFSTIKVYRALISVLLYAFAGMVIAAVIPRAGWYYHMLPALIMSVILSLIYVLIIFSATEKNTLRKEGYAAIFIALMVPLYICVYANHFGFFIKKHSNLNQLIAFIQAEKVPPSVYCFSANTTGDCFTLVYSTKSSYAGKYPFFWWMKGLQMMEAKGKLSPRIQKDKQFLIDAVADDLKESQPNWLIINTFDAKQTLKNHRNFIDYFSENEKFREIWSHYHYLKRVGVFEIYQRS